MGEIGETRVLWFGLGEDGQAVARPLMLSWTIRDSASMEMCQQTRDLKVGGFESFLHAIGAGSGTRIGVDNPFGSCRVSGGYSASITLNPCAADTNGGKSSVSATSCKCLL